MAKGYRNYRGRASKGKIFLAFLLVLIILAALSVLAMQRYIAYDENGTPFFRLPDREPGGAAPAPQPAADPPQSPEPPDTGLEVIVQEPEAPPAMKAFSLPAEPLTLAAWQAARAAAGDGYNAVAVTLKDAGGAVYYQSASAAKKAVKAEEDTALALAAITGDESLYTIARFSCLPDSFAPYMNNTPMGLKNKTNGHMFHAAGSAWLDPGREAAREYLCGLAREIAELGFDEILLTDTGYPTQGELSKLNYGSGSSIEENLCLLWEALVQALEPYDVKLSMELPEVVISGNADGTSGLVLARAVGYAERIYTATEPGRAEILSGMVLRSEAVTENLVEDFIPELTAPDPAWEGGILLLSNAESN